MCISSKCQKRLGQDWSILRLQNRNGNDFQQVPAFVYIRGEVKSCSLVLHGHTARVWGGRCLRDGGVISIGEDATCRVWDGQGRCVKVVEGHRGRSIWSMAVDEHSGVVVRAVHHHLTINTDMLYL